MRCSCGGREGAPRPWPALTLAHGQPVFEQHWRSRRTGALHGATDQQDARRAGVRLGCGVLWSLALTQGASSEVSCLELKVHIFWNLELSKLTSPVLAATPSPLRSRLRSLPCSLIRSAQHLPAARLIPSPQCTTECACVYECHGSVSARACLMYFTFFFVTSAPWPGWQPSE